MKTVYLIIALVLAGNLTFGQTKNFIDEHYLETTAKVDTLVKPDLIYLDIVIREKDERNRIPLEEMETKMIQKLESLGIDTEKQMSLSDLASNFKKYFLREKEVVKDKAYELIVYDSQTAGKVLVGLEAIGIANVKLNKTEYSKIEALKLELKSKAVQKAKQQADYLVKPLNQKITRAIHITDKFYEHYNNVRDELQEVIIVGYASAKKEYEQPSIEFRPIKVDSEVTIKFGIE